MKICRQMPAMLGAKALPYTVNDEVVATQRQECQREGRMREVAARSLVRERVMCREVDARGDRKTIATPQQLRDDDDRPE